MARPLTARLIGIGGWIAGGVVLLGAGIGLVHEGLTALIGIEEAAAHIWFAVYLDVGWATTIVLGAIVVLAALHLWLHGREDIRPRGPADRLHWWSALERTVHWALVLSFAVLLVTGVEMYVAGPGLPSPLTRTMRAWHVGEPFMVLGALLFLRWYRDAMPRRYDWHWLAHLGGYLRRREPLPAGRFNAGQKLWFWLEAVGGLVMAMTGYELEHHVSRFDPGYLTLLGLHLAAAGLFLTVLAVHFYLAVVGVRGALGGMVHGTVGRQGAHRLHSEARAEKEPSLDSTSS